MPNPIRILAFAGSARRESLNRKLLAAAVQEARAAGGEVTLLDLNELPFPLYHGDREDEQGLPDNVKNLVERLGRHEALLIASPEYNSMITPLLKNTIDWCSRAERNPFEGKVAAVISASPGGYGAVRSAVMTRQLLLKLGAHLVPIECSVPQAHEAFDAEGRLKSARTQESVRKVAVELVRLTAKLTA